MHWAIYKNDQLVCMVEGDAGRIPGEFGSGEYEAIPVGDPPGPASVFDPETAQWTMDMDLVRMGFVADVDRAARETKMRLLGSHGLTDPDILVIAGEEAIRAKNDPGFEMLTPPDPNYPALSYLATAYGLDFQGAAQKMLDYYGRWKAYVLQVEAVRDNFINALKGAATHAQMQALLDSARASLDNLK